MLSACKKITVVNPTFEVKTSKLIYKANEPVPFLISGTVDNIMFYSGEPRARYERKGQSSTDFGVTELEFTTATSGGKRDNSLVLLYTLDVVTATNVATANWKDLSMPIQLATNATVTSSGQLDISDLAKLNGPITFAFKYVAETSTSLAQPIWSIRSFFINTEFNDGTIIPITTLTNTQWRAFDIKNPAASWAISSFQLRMDGGAKDAPDNEDWLVTNAIDLKGQRELIDRGLAIQNIASNKLQQYSHTYSVPGTYKVAFVGFNNSIDEQQTIVRELEITILP